MHGPLNVKKNMLRLMLVLAIHVSDTQLEVTCEKLMSAADGTLCT